MIDDPLTEENTKASEMEALVFSGDLNCIRVERFSILFRFKWEHFQLAMNSKSSTFQSVLPSFTTNRASRLATPFFPLETR